MKKIIKLESCSNLFDNAIVGLCHGCFDVFHIGHLRYLKEAKSLCDILIVSVTADKYVNKGNNRPIFNEIHRMEIIESLEIVDYVLLSDNPTADKILEIVKPTYYFKGPDYKNNISKNLQNEIDICNKLGIAVKFTNDITSSSSWIINQLKKGEF